MGEDDSSAGRTRARPAPPASEDQPARSTLSSTAEPPGPRALLARLVGQSADDILSRLANGDPLKLYSRVAHRIRDRHFVLDPDRVFERALSVVAVGVDLDGSDCLEDGWLEARIDQAIRHVLDRDIEAEQAGIPAESPETHHAVFVQAFFRPPHLARLSSVRLNALSDRIRKGFYHLILEGRPLEEVLAMELGTPDQLQEDILRALQAIGLFDEKEFHQLLGRKETRP